MGKMPRINNAAESRKQTNRMWNNGKTMGMILNVVLMDLNGIESYLPVWLLNVVIIYETWLCIVYEKCSHFFDKRCHSIFFGRQLFCIFMIMYLRLMSINYSGFGSMVLCLLMLSKVKVTGNVWTLLFLKCFPTPSFNLISIHPH